MNECLPRILEPVALQAALARDDLIIIDLSLPDHPVHVPGAVTLDYHLLVNPAPPINGLLPDTERLSALFSSLGLHAQTHVVAYDDEGGAKACRLLWTLDVIGHTHYSLLNGGLTAWLNEGHPTNTTHRSPRPTQFTARINPDVIADKAYILAHLHDPATIIVDCRTPGEYAGHDVIALRGGHIPGAVNIEWLRAVDDRHNKRLKPAAELRSLYEGAGVTPDKEVIVYCHSHRRSAHTYFTLKHLGYERVRGYAGSWSEWGNDLHTPIEQ